MKRTNVKHETGKQAGKPSFPPRKPVYVYHWNRIIGAIVVFLMISGLGGYGLFLWLGSSPEEEYKMAETLPEAEVVEDSLPGQEKEVIPDKIEEEPQAAAHVEEDILRAAPATISDSDSSSQDTQPPLITKSMGSEDNPVQQSVENKPQNTEPHSPEIAELSAANDTDERGVEKKLSHEAALEVPDEPAAAAGQPSLELEAAPTQEEFSEPEAEISQDLPLEAEGESPENVDTTPVVDTPDSPFQLKEINILEPSVKRFLLARSVVNREPRGDLSEISLNAESSAAVWAYSEIVDKQGSRFQYVWLHGGKRIVTVAVNVEDNRWRSYSSKIFNQSMTGAWRVELQDGEGRLMASADFIFK